MRYFQCQEVSYLQDLYTSGLVHLSEDESSYIHLVVGSHCHGGYYTTRYQYLFVDIIRDYDKIAFALTLCSILPFKLDIFNIYCKMLMGCTWIASLMIAFVYMLIIEPTLLIFELDIKTARHLRILEINQCVSILFYSLFLCLFIHY